MFRPAGVVSSVSRLPATPLGITSARATSSTLGRRTCYSKNRTPPDGDAVRLGAVLVGAAGPAPEDGGIARTTRRATTRHGAARHDTARDDTARHDTTRRGMTRPVTTRRDTARRGALGGGGLAASGPARPRRGRPSPHMFG